LPENSPGIVILAAAPPGFNTDVVFQPADIGRVITDQAHADGREIVVGDGTGELHISLTAGADAARPLAVALPIDTAVELRLDVAKRFCRRLRGKRTGLTPSALRLTTLQRTRLIQLLHAFDVRSDGGGPRNVAVEVLNAAGEASLPAIEWKSSAARRKANRLIRDALTIVNGGYLMLLRGE
jgi:hypothetical protein